MTHTPRPDTAPHQPLNVQWFGASRRLVGGVPDSRYGWLDLPDGPCIVKAMDPDLAAYNQTLLDHERKILTRLKAMGAPAPAVVELGRSDWLATRFAGLSVQRLEQAFSGTATDPRVTFPLTERMSVWVHLLRRLQTLADRGVFPVDLYEANIVVPLTHGVHGQLRLHEPMLIDHAHTVEAGMGLRRPVWLNRNMARIAPELREALQQDQEALMGRFKAEGAALPGYSQLPGERDQLSRRLWAEYSAPQALQRLLDANQLNAGQAMQFAAATAMTSLLRNFPDMTCRQALQGVLARMSAEHAAERYTTLTDAAAALDAVMPPLPLASRHCYGPLQPADLQTPDQAAASALLMTAENRARSIVHTETVAHAAARKTAIPVGDTLRPVRPAGRGEDARPAVQAVPSAARSSRMQRRAVPVQWAWWAAGLGSALGMMIPLPW